MAFAKRVLKNGLFKSIEKCTISGCGSLFDHIKVIMFKFDFITSMHNINKYAIKRGKLLQKTRSFLIENFKNKQANK